MAKHSGALAVLFACLTCFLLPSCRSMDNSFDLLVVDVNVVDVANNRILPNQMVGVQDGRIAMVEAYDAEKESRYPHRTWVNGKGKYIMPALWDMHVHFRGGDSLIHENAELLPHFLSHGIAVVRDAGGDLTPAVMGWKTMQLDDPDLPYPRIFSCGPKLDGAEPAWPGSIPVTSQSDVVKALDSLESMDVDFVKLYDGSLSPEMYYALIRESEQRGLKVTGHMPMGASIMQGIEYGLDGTEHMHYLTKSCSPLEDSLTAEGLGYRMLPFIAESYDSTLARSRFRTLAQKQVYVCPTLFISKTLSELADADHSSDSMLPLIGEGIRSTYAMRIASAQRAKASGNTRRSRMLELSMAMIRPMYDEGVPLLAGSDCGAFNSYMYPGESLHRELFLLVEAGLEPYQALSTSVINGPAFFDLSKDYGAIAMGKQAELLILDANPLKNIRAIRRMAYIYHGGTLWEPRELSQVAVPSLH